MKVEIWSDYVCPFCYIGKRRFEQALETFPHRENVQVIYKSFELDPNAASETNETVDQMLARKYGKSIEEAKQMNQSVIEQAATVGLQYQFDHLKPTNTFDAHRLSKYAEEKTQSTEMTEKLLHAYFIDNRVLGNKAILADIAEEAGLDRKEVNQILESNKYEEAVRKDQIEAREIGVRGVPFFVLNGKYAISGAQPKEVFQNALQKVWEEESQASPLESLTPTNDAACSDDGCNLK